MYNKQKVIDIALAEVEYLEKETNAQLDDPTANAGDENYTKYARDLAKYPFFNGSKTGKAWCAVFVCWAFVEAYGVAAARKLLCLPASAENNYAAGCRYARNYFKSKGRLFDNPEPCDQVFFWPKDRSDPNAVQHTGLVVAVDDTYVHTVEGNTSGESGVVYNGGGVFRKKYKLGYSRFAGFGRPDWSMDEVKDTVVKATVRKGDKGAGVKELQELLNLDKRYGGLTVDGIFGSGTLASVRAFQADHGLTPDGVVGKMTWAALETLKAQQTRPVDPTVPPEVWQDMNIEEKVESLNERLRAVEGGESIG